MLTKKKCPKPVGINTKYKINTDLKKKISSQCWTAGVCKGNAVAPFPVLPIRVHSCVFRGTNWVISTEGCRYFCILYIQIRTLYIQISMCTYRYVYDIYIYQLIYADIAALGARFWF